ncbi:hypothetical protein [Pararhodobacter zhoushanensis]|uniref:hypothetical protein n=1 Tax=Pararhodobacter zhoushanensis TaxID=2479545 RepID=UPI000F8F4196|nr:hypothetical protein [Pararhodobacter zhoushanensis]
MSFTLTIETPEARAAETLATLQAQITAAIDALVEAQARALGYNSAAACAGYRDSTVPAWSAEAQSFIAWRDAVWIEAYAQQAAHAQAGTLPTADDVLAALPVWRD